MQETGWDKHHCIMRPSLAHGAVVNARNRMGQTPLHYATLKTWPGGVFMANSHHSGFACERIDDALIAATQRVISDGNNLILSNAASRSSEDRLEVPAHPGLSHGGGDPAGTRRRRVRVGDGANPAPGEKGFSEAAGSYCYTNGVRRFCGYGKEPSRTGGV
jgi:hypothetical protein